MNALQPLDKTMAPQIIENLSTSVFMFDEQLLLAYVNPAAEMLLGVGARKITGQKASDIFIESEGFIGHIQEACRTGQAFSEHEMTLSVLTAKTITVDCTVTPVTDAGVMSVLVELQQVDRHMRITREENLLAQNTATRALLRGMAHEIKNPLGGLRGAAQLLESELEDASLHEYTRIIIGEADRMQKLVDSMLGPNKLPKPEPTNILEVLERVRSLILAEASEGIKIIRDYDPSIPEIQGDKDSLIQAVLNIVRNAMESCGDQGEIILRTRIERKFTIGNEHHQLVARIDITDNGPGIPEDMIEKIFYPMISSRADGTGLGLTIAQTLINRHGGLIACESKPGKTRFTILLPLNLESGND
jgi:two-component system nitrogen regulation sensor histidine kinase GlnL